MWSQLFNRAYALAMQCNHNVILQDLPLMTELELVGVVSFLTSLKDS